MTAAPYQEALEEFTSFREFIITPITEGLINKTYKVTFKENGHVVLLQQINRHVFKHPEKVQDNYETLWKNLYQRTAGRTIPELIYFADDEKIFVDKNKKLFYDSAGEYWRVFEYIHGAETFQAARNTGQARAVAKAFAEFTVSFYFFDLSQLHNTIESFHDLSLRFREFKQSLHTRNYERLQKAAPVIDQLKKRERYASFYEVMTESEEFVKRVMHHDAKISNVLFDRDTGKVICPIDLDTAMPGYFFSDLGDMIRSMAASDDENSTNFDNLCIRKDFYEATTAGYLEVVGNQLTGSEKKYIHCSGLLIIYMQALRFLTDYLNEDVYYRITYPEQNFDRAKNQLTVLQKLEEFLVTDYQFKI